MMLWMQLRRGFAVGFVAGLVALGAVAVALNGGVVGLHSAPAALVGTLAMFELAGVALALRFSAAFRELVMLPGATLRGASLALDLCAALGAVMGVALLLNAIALLRGGVA